MCAAKLGQRNWCGQSIPNLRALGVRGRLQVRVLPLPLTNTEEKAVEDTLSYHGYWLLSCPECGQKHFCACYPPPLRTYQTAPVRVLPHPGESKLAMARDEVRLSWPSR